MKSLKDVMGPELLAKLQTWKERSQTDSNTQATRNSKKSEDESKELDRCAQCGGTFGSVGIIGGSQRMEPYGYGREYLVPVYDASGERACPECVRREGVAKYHPHRGMEPADRDKFFSFSEIDTANGKAMDQLRNLATHMQAHVKTGLWVYIYADVVKSQQAGKNPFGTGKTHFMCCMANEIAGKIPALFVTETDLFEDIQATFRGPGAQTVEVKHKYTDVPVLFIDDLFKRKPTEWVESTLFDIIDGRNKKGRVTVITSNIMPDRIVDVLNDYSKAGAIASRLNQATMVELMGKDRRRT